MDVEEVAGQARLHLLTQVLQRIRLREPTGGVWEAADVQWWWRRPRPTDDLPTPLWHDIHGPCAALSVVDWGENWQADVFVVRDTVKSKELVDELLHVIDQHAPAIVDIPVRDDEPVLRSLLRDAGFIDVGDSSPFSWMAVAARPRTSGAPHGFRVVDRLERRDRPHPMIARNGDEVERRLSQCRLYNPALDLSVETGDGLCVATRCSGWIRLHISGCSNR